jgi:regulator of protease activity HflC (stomatin/prohibitin superfamily)
MEEKKMDKKASAEGLTVMFLVGGILLILILFLGFDYVPAGHIGVKNRLGIVNPQQWGPGIQWTGIMTRTEKFDTRIQLREYSASSASKDMQIVSTKIALNFRVEPLSTPEIFKTIGLKYQDVIIAPIIQEAVKASTAHFNAEELITQRTAVKDEITNYITDRLQDKGLIVTQVAITDFDFSTEFNAAIERKQVAAQDALTAENRFKEMQFTSKSMELQKQVLEIKKLDIQLEWIKKWDGRLPSSLISQGDTVDMLLNLPTPEAINP